VTEVEYTEEDEKEILQVRLAKLPIQNKMLISLLREFMNRRKKSVTKYYNFMVSERQFTTPLAQLYFLYYLSPSHLFSIFTFHAWGVRGSGNLFSSECPMQLGLAVQIAKEQGFEEKLKNILFKKSGEKNKYRIFSYAEVDERVIIMLYKQISDVSIPDYNVGVRNQGVNPLMFELSINDNTLETKVTNSPEIYGIKEYIEKTFGWVFEPLKTDVFKNYDVKTFREVIINGKNASGKSVNDFMIERITFRGSPLKNSPELTLYLKNMDIWPSVMDAHYKKSVNVKSIKDLAYMTLKSENTSRTIRSIVKENGNVIFTMDDSRMDPFTKDKLKLKFFEKFGIPMYQEISNGKFDAGKADAVNFIMAQAYPESITEPEEKALLVDLEDQNLVTVETEYLVKCLNEECKFEERVLENYVQRKECPECQENEFVSSKVRSLKLNIGHITSFIKNSMEPLCINQDWVILKESKRKYSGTEYIFHNFERKRDGKVLILKKQRLITLNFMKISNSEQNNTLPRLQTKLMNH
jgi:hypothetical protein